MNAGLFLILPFSEAGHVLKFFFFQKFEPQRSYKLGSYIKKSVYTSCLVDVVRRRPPIMETLRLYNFRNFGATLLGFSWRESCKMGLFPFVRSPF